MNAAIILPSEIGPGKEREVQTLLADTWRKVVLIRLRDGALLADHSAKVPITIQALLGKGVLDVGGEAYSLTPGVLVPVDAHVIHKVQADPALAILVTFFRQPETEAGTETTAKFD
jgi:quercetin dioxygenase-like cupin family protein